MWADGVATSVLGMNKIIGDDSLRRALAAIAPAPNKKHSDEQGAQQQAQLARAGYNPHKPGRPSHAIHTYRIGNMRLVIDAQLDSGDRHSPLHGRSGLVALLEGMPKDHRPQLVRGDSAFGSEGEMAALEPLDQS